MFMAYSGFWILIAISEMYATSETTWEVNLEERDRGEALKTHPASQHWGGCVTPRRLRNDHESNSETRATPQRVPVVPPLDLAPLGKDVSG